MERATRLRAGRVAMLAGVLVLGGKLVTYLLTGSSAVFSDAMESVVNVVAAAVLLYSLVVSSRPADQDHPYGHGKVEYFSAGVEGAMIAVAACLIFFEAVRDLLAGPHVERIDAGLILVGVFTLVNAAAGGYLISVGRRTQSLALIADGKHLMTDVVTSVGVLGGLGAVALTGWMILDPLVAIVVALNILRTGWKLLREAVSGLMDEADISALTRISNAMELARPAWWIDVHSLRAWRSGNVQHADMHLSVPRYFDADRLHRINHEIERVVLESSNLPGDVIIHFDPCRPRQCAECAMEDCDVRGDAFVARDPITFERATREDELLESGVPVQAAETL